MLKLTEAKRLPKHLRGNGYLCNAGIADKVYVKILLDTV